jgi:hypothetical protein
MKRRSDKDLVSLEELKEIRSNALIRKKKRKRNTLEQKWKDFKHEFNREAKYQAEKGFGFVVFYDEDVCTEEFSKRLKTLGYNVRLYGDSSSRVLCVRWDGK